MFLRGEIYKGRKVIGVGVINLIGEMKRFYNVNRKLSNGCCRSFRGF